MRKPPSPETSRITGAELYKHIKDNAWHGDAVRASLRHNFLSMLAITSEDAAEVFAKMYNWYRYLIELAVERTPPATIPSIFPWEGPGPAEILRSWNKMNRFAEDSVEIFLDHLPPEPVDPEDQDAMWVLTTICLVFTIHDLMEQWNLANQSWVPPMLITKLQKTQELDEGKRDMIDPSIEAQELEALNDVFAQQPLLNFQPKLWNPITETKADARRRILSELRVELGNHLDAIEARFNAAGYEKTPTSREQFRHLQWVVMYHVLELPFAEISRRENVERQSVEKAIKRMADLIGLSLRPPSTGGRPASE